MISKEEARQGDFTVKDSGERHEFDSGMVRDTTTGKTDYELVFNGPMLDRWAEHLTKGATKYPDPVPGKANWMRASGEAELHRFRKSAVRHFIQWLRGDKDEDHAAAVFFNINGAEYVKDKMAVATFVEKAAPLLGEQWLGHSDPAKIVQSGMQKALEERLAKAGGRFETRDDGKVYWVGS